MSTGMHENREWRTCSQAPASFTHRVVYKSISFQWLPLATFLNYPLVPCNAPFPWGAQGPRHPAYASTVPQALIRPVQVDCSCDELSTLL